MLSRFGCYFVQTDMDISLEMQITTTNKVRYGIASLLGITSCPLDPCLKRLKYDIVVQISDVASAMG